MTISFFYFSKQRPHCSHSVDWNRILTVLLCLKVLNFKIQIDPFFPFSFSFSSFKIYELFFLLKKIEYTNRARQGMKMPNLIFLQRKNDFSKPFVFKLLVACHVYHHKITKFFDSTIFHFFSVGFITPHLCPIWQ